MKQNIEIQLFGPIIGFSVLHKITHIELELCETYQKMGYRNRFQILTAGGVLNLSVPLVGGRDQKRETRDVEIDYSGRWLQEHWRTMESNYNRSPFFEFYAPSIKPIFEKRPAKLSDLCVDSLQWTLKQLNWAGQLSFSQRFEKEVDNDVYDFRNRFLPKNRLNYPMPKYQQQFGIRFEPNLSILDLLFNLGPHSTAYLNNLPLLN
jgi:WbqC-like protein family